MFLTEHFGEPSHARFPYTISANLPRLQNAIRPNLRGNHFETGFREPPSIVSLCSQRRAQKSFADFVNQPLRIRIRFVVTTEPCAYRNTASWSQPILALFEESRFVEEMFGALDAPHHIGRTLIKRNLFGIRPEELRLIPGLAPSRSPLSPATLDGADGHSCYLALEFLGQQDTRTTHATTDIDDAFISLDGGEHRHAFGQLTLRDLR